MKFSEYRQLSEARKDLLGVIGTEKTEALLKRKVLTPIQKHHDSVFGKGNNHIEFPLENDMPEHVKDHVESNGDSLSENGVKLKSGREVPVSKYLAKSGAPKNVQDEHQNWEKNKVANSKLVITRNPAEVASASVNTHWSSCANPKNPSGSAAWKCIPSEIKHGTLMAMHVHKDAKVNEHGEYDSKDVLGRVLIKHHEPADYESTQDNSKEITFHREGRKYGAFPESANKVVDEFTKKHYPQTNLLSRKHEKLYDDDNQAFKVNFGHKDLEHAFTDGHEKELVGHIQTSIVGHENADEKVFGYTANSKHTGPKMVAAGKTKNPETLRKLFHDKEYLVAMNAASNPHIPKELIDAGLKHDDVAVRRAAIANPNATPEHISKALQDGDANVRHNAITHKNVTGEHITKALTYKDKGVRELAMRHHDVVTASHIDTALNDSDANVRAEAIRNPKATEAHLTKGMNDTSYYVRGMVANHPNATKEHIDKAMNDSHHGVVARALENPNTTKEHVDKSMHSSNPTIRELAVSHKNATEEHITKGLKDIDIDVRRAAIKNPKVTGEHITKALSDKDFDVRHKAMSNEHATPEHINKALDDTAESIRSGAAQHDNASSENLHKALRDRSISVRLGAMSNKNINSSHIDKALDDNQLSVQTRAAEHHLATVANLHKALDDNYSDVRKVAAGNKNATKDVLEKAAKDDDEEVRNIATHRLKTGNHK